MEKIKAGIIGTGFIGPEHLEAIRRLGFVEVVALAESSDELAKRKADELHIPKAFGDYRKLLTDEEIQVIHNCTPNYLHYQISRDSILSGKHVLSEKPLAVSSKESAELLELAQRQQVVHGINFNYRQNAQICQLKALIDNGKLGRINLVHGSYLQDWLLFDTDYSWRLEPEIGGPSRAVADIGSHWCDTVQYVTGERITEVFADLATILPIRKRPGKASAATFSSGETAGEEYEEIAITTEDYATVLFKLSSGARGVFTVSQVSPGRKNRLSFEIDGSKSAAFWNQEEQEKLWLGYRDKANECLLADPGLLQPETKNYLHHPGGHNEGWPDALKNMMYHYYDFIRQGKKLLNHQPDFATFADGHLAMCIVEAIVESSKTGKWVQVHTDR